MIITVVIEPIINSTLNASKIGSFRAFINKVSALTHSFYTSYTHTKFMCCVNRTIVLLSSIYKHFRGKRLFIGGKKSYCSYYNLT